MVTWKNDDAVTHRIVLSDGTEVGTIAPGEASNPVAMSAPSVGYYCMFHPSMTGIISDPSMAPPALPPDYYPPGTDPY
jgi:plastocyanin